MSSTAEFLVAGIVTGESDYIRVVGRCGDVSIHVGDHFKSLVQVETCKTSIYEAGHAVDLKVVSIQAYERSIDAMEPGMTGSLALIGDGAQWLAPSSILGLASIATSQSESKISEDSSR